MPGSPQSRPRRRSRRGARATGKYSDRVEQEVRRAWATLTADEETVTAASPLDELTQHKLVELRAFRDAKAILDAEERQRQAESWLSRPFSRLRSSWTSRRRAPSTGSRACAPLGQPSAGRQGQGREDHHGAQRHPSLTDGSPLFSRFDVVPVTGRVALLDLGMPTNSLRRWMRNLGFSSDQLLVLPLRGRGGWLAAALTDPVLRSRFAASLRAHHVEVLIIDPLAALLAGAGVDENSNTEVSSLLRGGLAALQEEAGISEIMLVHHAGHQAKRVRGASSLLDWPDAIWDYAPKERRSPSFHDEDLDLDHQDAPRYLRATGRDVDLPEVRVDYDPETRLLSIAADAASSRAESRRVRDQAKDEELLRVLEEDLKGCAPSDKAWSDAVGGSSAEYRNARDRLVNSGRVLKVEGRTKNAHGYQIADFRRRRDDPLDPSRPSSSKALRRALSNLVPSSRPIGRRTTDEAFRPCANQNLVPPMGRDGPGPVAESALRRGRRPRQRVGFETLIEPSETPPSGSHP